jgi:transcriptional antiterminator NusG
MSEGILDPARERRKPRWYAVQTYPYQEQLVAEQFAARGICHYLPMTVEKHPCHGGFASVHIPLFKTYLFINVIPSHDIFSEVRNTRGVARILGGSDGPVPVPSQEIRTVARASGQQTLAAVRRFRQGQRVRVTRGPLKGTEGVFISAKGKARLACHMRVLGQTVWAEVRGCDVETGA